ncbi:hypothetical protein Tco_0291217 [Tanacetum coccineum]
MANVTSLLTSLYDNFKNSASTSNSGTLPSQTVTNPRQQINAITKRSLYNESNFRSPCPLWIVVSPTIKTEIDIFLVPDDLIPLGVENDDSEDEVNESPNLDHQDDPSIPRPPPEREQPSILEMCFKPERLVRIISDITRKTIKNAFFSRTRERKSAQKPEAKPEKSSLRGWGWEAIDASKVAGACFIGVGVDWSKVLACEGELGRIRGLRRSAANAGASFFLGFDTVPMNGEGLNGDNNMDEVLVHEITSNVNGSLDADKSMQFFEKNLSNKDIVVAIFGVPLSSIEDVDVLTRKIKAGDYDEIKEGMTSDE